MTMLSSIRDRLIEIEKTLTTDSSETADAALYMPPTISIQKLPIFTNIWRATRNVTLQDTLYNIQRTMEVRLILEKTGDRLYSENENRISEWIEVFYKDMVKRPRLELEGVGLPGTNGAAITGDNGGAVTPYPVGNGAQNFYQVIFTMVIDYNMRCA